MPPKKQGTTTKATTAQQDQTQQPEVPVLQQADNQIPEQSQAQQSTILPTNQTNQINIQIQSNGNQRVVTDSNNQTNGQQHVSQRVVNLSSDQTKVQSGSSEIKTDGIEELSLKEKKELRKQRFQLLGSDPSITTADALERVKEEKEKRLLRAQKFGLITEDVEEQKRQERAIKFGLTSTSTVTGGDISKTETDEKKQQRAIRFGLTKVDEEEDEKKRKRQERFGVTDQLPGNRVIKRLCK